MNSVGGPLRVLFSFDNVGETTINPFTDMLFESIRTAGAKPVAFSWLTALAGHYDIMHLHWPENHLRASRWYLRIVQYLLFVAVLVGLRLRRIPIAQTQHNRNPHEPGRVGERVILGLATRWTQLWIRLVEEMEIPGNVPSTASRHIIPHGTYSERYAATDRPPQRPGRLLFFGLIRPYKGVDVLLRAFIAVPDSQLELRICGEAQDEALHSRITSLAKTDNRITVRLEFLPEEDLIGELAQSEIVILPYSEMHNSGAAILALSVDRPVIVPDGDVTRRLESDVGQEWVVRYENELNAASLIESINSVRRLGNQRGVAPLRTPSWPEIGAMHVSAYREVLSQCNDRRDKRGRATQST